MTTLPLAESKNATADAAGTATVSLGPLRAFEKWVITRTTVSSTSANDVPTAKVYRGAVQPSRLIDGSYDGTFDTSDTRIELMSGDKIVVEWTGSDVGAVCTATIEGEVIK